MRFHEFNLREGLWDDILGYFSGPEPLTQLVVPRGGRGPEVADIQKVLKADGFGSLLGPYGDNGVDGIIGDFTKRAIGAFQKKHNITQTNSPDRATVDVMNNLVKTQYKNLTKSTARDVVSGQPMGSVAGGGEWSGRGQYPYASAIEATAKKYGFPVWALAGLIARESNFNPRAIGDGDNSWGLGQFNRRGAAAEYKLSRNEILSMSPEQQIDLIGDFLSKKIKQAGGNVWGGLKLYNGGGDPQYIQHIKEKLPRLGFTEV